MGTAVATATASRGFSHLLSPANTTPHAMKVVRYDATSYGMAGVAHVADVPVDAWW